eukprot:CAMPEP_0201670508 /NCGR_PEP_ID=MMETSP0494-20130426/26997_1 /ASSEMBLY_ACC=CAM_ASM_000839 /TAXON_ID=420259 /ORGANISM="Thalassiosira gravida, Strain GMp14c1" /LENGTH=95 /DNA_ID=CAMNT_0048151587 /DNA_START=500 /DNA_END=785 /DNA_ORIENTATION=+
MAACDVLVNISLPFVISPSIASDGGGKNEKIKAAIAIGAVAYHGDWNGVCDKAFALGLDGRAAGVWGRWNADAVAKMKTAIFNRNREAFLIIFLP